MHLLGAGAQQDALKQQVAELDMGDAVFFHPAVSRDEAVKRMEEADLLYLNLKQNPTLERTIPSKVFDYLIAGRPIVAGLAGEGQSLLESTEADGKKQETKAEVKDQKVVDKTESDAGQTDESHQE